jgi:hypothetical protein
MARIKKIYLKYDTEEKIETRGVSPKSEEINKYKLKLKNIFKKNNE